MNIKSYPRVEVPLDHVIGLKRREIPYRKMVYLACLDAILQTPYKPPLPPSMRAGIAFSTIFGENFPLKWLKAVTVENRRLSATEFESTVHTSAPGFASLELGLTGPMVVLTHGYLDLVARTQLLMGRATLMLVCSADENGPATCYVLEAR